MKPPKGLVLRISDRDVANNTATVEVTVEDVTHACPPVGSGLMPCCGRSPNEVPLWHRITLDDEFVTCASSGRSDR